MPDTGFVIAGAGANVDTADIAWSNPGNITADDGANASVVIFAPSVSDRLRASSFGLSVPSGAAINGIEVQIQCNNSFGNAVWDYVNVGKDNSTLGTSKDPNQAVPGTVTNFTQGGPTDLWGLSWTAAEVNASTFQALISETAPDPHNMFVDAMWVKVYYTEGTNFPVAMEALSYEYSFGGLSLGVSMSLAALSYDYSFGGLSLGINVQLAALGPYEYSFGSLNFKVSPLLEALNYEYSFGGLVLGLDATLGALSYEYSFADLGLEVCHFTWGEESEESTPWTEPGVEDTSWTEEAEVDFSYSGESVASSNWAQPDTVDNTYTEQDNPCEDEI